MFTVPRNLQENVIKMVLRQIGCKRVSRIYQAKLRVWLQPLMNMAMSPQAH
jgi:hypothetical protein